MTAARRRRSPLAVVAVAALAAAVLVTAPAAAQRNDGLPPQLENVGVDQRLGETVPLDDTFLDESGRPVTLGQLAAEAPIILALVYYDCPMLCNMVLDGVARAVMPITLEQGADYRIVAVSFAAEETPELATSAKEHLFERYRAERAGWHFLTGEPAAITRLTEAVGFRYRYLEENGEYAHSAAIAVVTPEGRISRYFYGIDYPPRDLRLALVEAADERIGSLADQVLLYCFRYDPATGRYTFAVWAVIRAAGVLTAVGIGLYLLLSLRRDRRARRPAAAH